MKGIGSLLSQWRAVRTAVGVMLTVSLALLGVVLLLHLWKGIPIGHLTRDPVHITKAPTYLGLLSYAGILLWSAAGAVCFFSATLLLAPPREDPSTRSFLYASGFFTLLLTLDDLFLLHETVATEPLVYGAYVLLGVVYLLTFRNDILATDYLLLTLALGLFALSIAFDVWGVPVGGPYLDPYLVEDGVKFAGIVTWLLYFARVSGRALDRRHAATAPGSRPPASVRTAPSSDSRAD